MKAIKCEMCGSNDVVKQDGLFVCQNCGTKYSVEEARKLMIEGTVDVKGTVKVDTSDELQARRDTKSGKKFGELPPSCNEIGESIRNRRSGTKKNS